ncbi:MAG: hypothetical protein AAFY02_07475 [Pseudomonadota bacterium]
MRKIFLFATGLLLLPGAQATAEPANGLTLMTALSGNTVVGSMDESGDYAEFFAPSGALYGTAAPASWYIDGNRVCFRYHPGPYKRPDCVAAAIDGSSITWMDQGEPLGSGEILEGDPRGLQ